MVQDLPARLVLVFKGNGLGPHNGLIFRLPQIQPLMVDILLDHRIDEAGDIPVLINVLPDLSGADVLQALGQLQLLHLSGDAFIDLSRPGVTGPAEDQMVEAMDGIFLWLLFIGAGVMDHVRSRHDIDLLLRKDLPKPLKIRRIGDIDGDIVGKQVDIKLIGHGHIDDLPAHQMGLGLFRPGKLVDGQEHRIAQLPDPSCDLLVGQGERVKGARKKRHLAAAL